jgi:hypothetical protein
MKIIEIWKKHIMADLESEEEQEETDEIYYDEAKEHLKNILLFFEVELGRQDVLTAECNIAFSLVMLKTGNFMVALESLDTAYYTFLSALGEFDNKTKDVGELIKKINAMREQTHEGEMEME